MDKLEFKPLLATLDDYDAYLFDLWGVIIEGAEVYAEVIDTINQISASGKRVFFVSNAPRPKLASFERLRSWGLQVTADSVFTSGEIARQMIAASAETLNIDEPVVYHLGADRNFEILSELGVSVTEYIARANVLLLTVYRDEGNDLTEFDALLAEAASKNIICICANPDTIIPNLGKNRYCSGYFGEKFEKLGGKVIYTGKPHAEIFNQVLSVITEIPKSRILMIGDTLDTDIIGANNVGIHSALVMTGNAHKLHSAAQDFDEKLSLLYQAATGAKIVPTFATTLAQ